MATLTLGMAMMGIAGLYGPQSGRQSFPIVPAAYPVRDDEYLGIPAISGPLPPTPNDFQKPAIVDLTPTARATIFAEELADVACGETLTWAQIQIQYRRLARDNGWRPEIADRLLSKALKSVGAIRGQQDRRSTGGGRPITITFPGLGP